MSNIQLARLKSVSNNFSYSFVFNSSSPNAYQVTGAEPVGPDGVFHNWNDANGNGTQDEDQIYTNPRSLPYGAFNTTGISTLPNGSFPGTAPATITISFLPDGRLDQSQSATNYRCFVLQDLANTTRAVCVENSGLIRFYRHADGAWTETK